MPNTPTEEQFFQLVEWMFGSRYPNLEACRKRFRRSLMECCGENPDTPEDASGQEMIRMRIRHMDTLIDATQIGLDHWQELERDEQAQIVSALATSKQQIEREAYMMNHLS